MPEDHDAVLDRFTKVWMQIATRYKDYPSTLMLESINEPGFDGVDDATQAVLLDEVNTAFFYLVRGTGGGNATRPLVLPTVYTRADQEMLDSLKDTITQLNDPNLIATIHYYGWYPFSVNLGGYTKFDETSIYWADTPLNAAYDTFVADGIPVVLGEFGVLQGNQIQHGELLKYYEYVSYYARSKGMTHMLWETGGIFNRISQQWNDPELHVILMHTLTGRATTSESNLFFLYDEMAGEDAVTNLNLNGDNLVSVQDGTTTLTPGSDYLLNGEALTIKAHVLSKYATGAFGEKGTLTINVDSGPAWKIFVRYASTPVPSALVRTTGAQLAIPVAFNGDLLATMESKNGDGSDAGPINWTSFQEFGKGFWPDYANNTITLPSDFFKNSPPGVVNLSFHFWSGRILSYQLEIVDRSGQVGTEYVISDDGLAAGWNNWGSWATNNLTDTTEVRSGSTAISVTPGAYGALGLVYAGPTMDTSAYHTLVFWIHGGTAGGQRIGVGAVRGNDWSSPWIGLPELVANTWQRIEFPLCSLGVEGSPNITGLYFQNWTGGDAPTFYIDDILLSTAKSTTVMDIYGTPAPIITSAVTASGMVGSPFSYTIAAIKDPDTFSATELPAGLTVDASSGVISGSPLVAGWHFVTLGATNEAGTNTETLKLYVAPAPVVITLPGGDSPFGAAIQFAYDGAPRSVGDLITTTPEIPVTVTYNGSTTVPTLPGMYHVIVTSNDPNYIGVAETTLEITVTALVRHAPSFNGDIDGSLQLLTGETFAVNGSGSISGDLLVPGTPTVQLNGNPVFSVVDAEGAIAPANYAIALNGGAMVRFIMRRVDPIAMPVATAPDTPTGTRNVTLNNANQNPGNFATIRNLTLDGNAGTVAVPPGAYGNFTVNGNGSLVLGVDGATEPSVYNFQRLTMNGNSTLQIVGPVVLRLANSLNMNGAGTSAAADQAFAIEIASGDLTLNGSVTLNASALVPNGRVTINGSATLHGRVSADRLTINGNGLLEEAMP